MAKDSDDDWLLSDEDTDTLHRSMDMEQRDRIKMESQFQTMGYREGLEHGKLIHMQQGFDVGYNTVGVPLGHAIGELRGAADTLLFAVKQRQEKAKSRSATSLKTTDTDINPNTYTRLKALCTELSQVKLADIAEPDWEVVKHEAEHHSAEDTEAVLSQLRSEYEACGNRFESLQQQLRELERELLS